MHPRRIALAFAPLVAAVTLAACSSTGTSSGTGPVPGGFTPANPGVLTVATSLPSPGFWDGDSPQDIHGGYEYGMAQDLSKRLGLGGRVRVVNVSFDALVAGQAKNFDLALSTINITPARAKAADFSTPYLGSDQGILVRTGTTVTQANERSLKWGVQSSSVSEDFLTTAVKPRSEPSVYQDQPSMFAALAARQTDAVLLDTITILPVAKASHGSLSVVGQYHTSGVYGALYPKGSPNEKILNKLIGRMKTDGTLASLSKRYLAPALGKDPGAVPYLQP